MGSTRRTTTMALTGTLAAVLALGCATGIQLTERGTSVQPLSQVEPGCRMIGDVAIGIPPDAARPRTEEQLSILMRNKAGEMGASHVLIETSEQRTEGNTPHWVGRGTAYSCDPSAAATPAEPPAAEDGETAGGETPPLE